MASRECKTGGRRSAELRKALEEHIARRRRCRVAQLIYGFILGYYENGVLERAPGHFKLPVANLGLDYGEPSRWMSLSVPGEA